MTIKNKWTTQTRTTLLHPAAPVLLAANKLDSKRLSTGNDWDMRDCIIFLQENLTGFDPQPDFSR